MLREVGFSGCDQQGSHRTGTRPRYCHLWYKNQFKPYTFFSFKSTTMKTLYLVRHAKSSWNNSNLSDHARPLNDRGKRDAPQMGKRLRKRKPQPALIITSSAVRAETTATLLAEAIGYPTSDITIDERLYGAEPKDVIAIIGELDKAIDCAMLVGHNPTFTDLINALSGSQIDNVPTCGMAVLKFPTNTWSTIAQTPGELLDFDYPKND